MSAAEVNIDGLREVYPKVRIKNQWQ
jgi:hypothetical protein